MNVNFEFLGSEPIENVITCMNYEIDKVVYFGYHETIERLKSATENFLGIYCGVQKAVFHALPKDDLASALRTMRHEIEYEKGRKNRIFFDVTGGEDLILVAFGMLAKEFRLPLHSFDVPQNRLIVHDDGSGTVKSSIDELVARREFCMDLDRYIALRGGVINYSLQKDMKADGAEENADDIRKIWKISEKYEEYWNAFSEFLRGYFAPDPQLKARSRTIRVLEGLYTSSSSLNELTKLHEILEDLSEEGILLGLVQTDEYIEFSFRNEVIREILWDSGSIFELHVWQEEKELNDDCRAGVHLDWDGIIRWPEETDVQNEIDVLTVKGNSASFISCKGGKLSPAQTLRALYELQVVADRFGGRYAKRVLAIRSDIGRTYTLRAEEMGIEVRKY